MTYRGVQFFRRKYSVECDRLMGFLLLILLYAGMPVASAQNSSKSSPADNKRIDSMIRYAKKLARANPAKALEILQQAKTESEKINYQKGILRTILFEADYNYGINIDESIRKAYEALDYYERSSINNSMFRGDAERILADAYDEIGKKDSAAYFYYLMSRQIEEDSTYSPEFIVDIMMKLTGFTVSMNYDTAYLRKTINQYLHRAQIAAAQIPDSSPYKGSIHFLEGIYYGALKQYKKSSESFIRYLEDRGDGIPIPRRISTYLNIGDAYMKANDPRQAILYVDSAIEICEKPQFKESFSFYRSIANLVKGQVLYHLEDYRGAIDLINSSLAYLSKTGTSLQTDAIDAHEVLAKAYQAIGEKDKALEHKNIYQQLRDSVLQRDRMDMVSMLEVRYGLEEKNRQITEQKLRNIEAQTKIHTKNFWLITSGCAIIILLLLATLYRRNSLHKQRLQTELINNIQQRQEIELLNAAITGEERERNRIAMELHDGIGGILSAAKMNLEMAKKGHVEHAGIDLEKGIGLVDKAGKELRKTAHNMMPEYLIQEGLVAAVEYFCDSMSTSNNTQIKFQVVGNPVKLNPAFELSVYRIIQELLHNVLKHAKARQALVQLSYNQQSLNVTVEDDGVGIAQNKTEAKPGIGLASVKQRVQAIKGTLALQTAKDEGTSIYMEFEPQPISL